MIKTFDELFSIQNGVAQPKVPIHINGITMTPGVSFTGGVSFGGVDFMNYEGKNFNVEIKDGVYHVQPIG